MANVTKLNKKLVKRLAEAIGRGATQRMACGMCKINEVTFCSWHTDYKLIQKALAQGKQLEEVMNIEIADKTISISNCILKNELFESIQKHESEYYQSKLDTINTAADKDWNAAKWVLERRCRKDFAPTNTLNVGNVEGETFKQEIQGKTMEQQFLEFQQRIKHIKLGDPKEPPTEQ